MSKPWSGIVGKGFTPEEFAAYVEGIKLAGWKPSFVVCHNTSAPTLAQWPSTPGEQRMQNLQSYYRDQQHWSAGPHLFCGPDKVWAFTPLWLPGVHSPSWNKVSWGVEIVGEYETEEFCGSVKDNAVSALATLHKTAGLDPTAMRFHKEDPKTTHKLCPGKHVVKADLIAAVNEAMK